MSKKNASRKTILIALCLAMTMVVVAILLCFLLNGQSVYYSTEDIADSVGILNCNTRNLDDSFFKELDTVSIAHNIKITFNDGEADKISYTYDGMFKDTDSAAQAEAINHAKYNLYMGGHGLSKDLLSVFSGVNNINYILRITGDESSINEVTAKLFYLDDVYMNYGKMGPIDFEKIFTNRGFSCEYNN